MATNTASYAFLLPTVGGDTNLWGGYLNSNWQDVDDLLDGTAPVAGIDINSGSIDGTPIGASVAAAGSFTSLTGTGKFALYATGDGPTDYGAVVNLDVSDNLVITRERKDGGAASAWAQLDVPGSSSAADDLTIMTRIKSDARYLQLAGGTMTGETVMAAGSLLTMLQIRSRASDSTHDISIRDNAGSTAYAWDIRAQTTIVGGLQLRHNNVALFNLASTGSITLAGSSGAFISGTGGVVSNGEIQTRTDGNNSLGFRKAAGTINGLLYFNRAGATADVPGKLTVNYYDEDGTDARVAATIENPISKGGTLSSATSIVTREHGDVRYPQKFDGSYVADANTVFEGNADTLFGPNYSTTVFCNTIATNTPAAVNGTLFVHTHPTNGNFTTQTFIETTSVSPRQWYRARSSGIWSTWSLLSSPESMSGLLTEQATTSGTVFDFTGIPAGVRAVEVMLEACSLSGTDNFLIQLGDAGGVETTGYEARGGGASSTAGFVVQNAGAAFEASGTLRLNRMGGNRWLGEGTFFRGAGANNSDVSGRKELSAELDRVRITRTGTNTFDAGAVNVRWLL